MGARSFRRGRRSQQGLGGEAQVRGRATSQILRLLGDGIVSMGSLLVTAFADRINRAICRRRPTPRRFEDRDLLAGRPRSVSHEGIAPRAPMRNLAKSD